MTLASGSRTASTRSSSARAGRAVDAQRLDLALLRFGIHAMQLERQIARRLAVGVDADDDALSRLLGELEVIGRVRDLLLEPAGLDAGNSAAALVDLVEIRL